jgi:hypothetical protein
MSELRAMEVEYESGRKEVNAELEVVRAAKEELELKLKMDTTDFTSQLEQLTAKNSA